MDAKANNWTAMAWRTANGVRVVLVGPVARTLMPVLTIECDGIQHRLVPADEMRYMQPVPERTKRSAASRFRGVARRLGACRAARVALGL